ncbi:MAG: hypothetical protein IIY55_05450, partial [Blautia sp.]|nr:hypothetical protein [Blautia sp.]
MTQKELKKLKRGELLELLVTHSKEIDRLTKELEEANRELADRRVLIDNSGSIAEASLAIYKVLENAQKAADLYLENVQRRAEEGLENLGQARLENIPPAGSDAGSSTADEAAASSEENSS